MNVRHHRGFTHLKYDSDDYLLFFTLSLKMFVRSSWSLHSGQSLITIKFHFILLFRSIRHYTPMSTI